MAFASEHDDVVFARGASQLRLVNADPYLNELLVRSCEEVLSHQARSASSIRVRVENTLAPLLPHGTARAGEVARALGMSERTLARRLAEEDLTFLAVLEDMRKDLALHYLADASLSISRIAWLLGYQEVSGFTHAFRRWTGQAPTQIRADILGRRRPGPTSLDAVMGLPLARERGGVAVAQIICSWVPKTMRPLAVAASIYAP